VNPLPLYARDLVACGPVSGAPFVGRLVEEDADADPSSILLVRGSVERAFEGHRAALVFDKPVSKGAQAMDTYVLGPSQRYLEAGDVVRIDPRRGALSVLFRRASPFNAFLVTERCDNFCVMCSQPPKAADDSWLVDELLGQVLPLLPPDTGNVGITGGEPGLLGDRLVDLVGAFRDRLPQTSLHILSNGRSFAAGGLAQRLGDVRHPDVMLGVPLYSDLAVDHDFVVQARGGFDEAVRGTLRLAEAGVPVEIRVVVHRATASRLVALARFVSRNLRFASHIAFMGLEQVGFAKTNLDELWIDPLDYADVLAEAVEITKAGGMNVSVYNHQLCTLPARLHPIARRSISDWKNVYLPACEGCRVRPSCGGFFASTRRSSRGIRPVDVGAVHATPEHAQP
jgi:His-Xaa-Ser system radical SAM maturase HxsC